MKRLYTILAVLMISSAQLAFSQSAPSFGLRAGMTVSDLRGDAMQTFNNVVQLADGMVTSQPRTGFHAGGFMNIPVAGILSVEPGIYYSQKGYRMQGNLDIKALDFLGANASAELQSTYIDVPVVLKANL